MAGVAEPSVQRTPRPAATDRHDAFLSYSRKDGAAARRLGATLESQGKDVWVDVEDILGGADWRGRIKRGIEACKAFVFLLSPASLDSDHCRQELELAVALNKLVIPVLLSEVDERAVPASLADREWVFLRDGDDFDTGLARLVEALETDLQWRDEHTRLAGRTREWLDSERDKSSLLRGAELTEAERWLAAQASHRENATGEQAEYILASRRTAVARQRTLLGTVGAGLAIAVGLAIFALIQRNDAIEQKRAALSRGLTVQSQSSLASDPALAAALRIEADRLRPSSETRDGMLSVLAALHPAIGTLAGMHQGSGVAFSPDATTIAGAGASGVVLWDAATRERLARLDGHGPCAGVAMSATLVACGAADGTVALWDAARRSPAGVLAGHAGPVNAVALSRDGVLASAGVDGTVRLWDPARRKPVGDPLTGHAGSVEAVAFSPDGGTLASAGSDGAVVLWDVAGRRELRRIAGDGKPLHAVAFGPGGRTLAFGGEGRGIVLWDVARDRRRAVLRGHSGPIRALAFNPRRPLLASGAGDRSVRLWNPDEPRAGRSRLAGHADWVQGVAFSPDGRRVASVDARGGARLWDVAAHRPLRSALAGHGGAVTDVAFGRGSTLVSTDRAVRVWDAATRAQARTLAGGRATSIAVSPSGATLASAAAGPGVTLRDLASGRPIAPSPLAGDGDGAKVFDMTLDRAGKRLAATTGSAGTLLLWDLKSGRRQAETLDRRAGLYGVAFGRGGTLAYADGDGAIRVRDIARPRDRERAFARGHAGAVNSMAFSPDGTLLASGGADGDVRLWDVAGRRPAGDPLAGSGAPVNAVAFSPDGRTLASAGESGEVRVWDVASRRLIGSPLAGHRGAVDELSFSRDGSLLASAGADGKVVVWRSILWGEGGGGHAVRRAICERVERSLSRSEWERFVPGERYRRTCVSG